MYWVQWDTEQKIRKGDGRSVGRWIDRDGLSMNFKHSEKYFNKTPNELQGVKIGK